MGAIFRSPPGKTLTTQKEQLAKQNSCITDPHDLKCWKHHKSKTGNPEPRQKTGGLQKHPTALKLAKLVRKKEQRIMGEPLGRVCTWGGKKSENRRNGSEHSKREQVSGLIKEKKLQVSNAGKSTRVSKTRKPWEIGLLLQPIERKPQKQGGKRKGRSE